MAEKDKEQPGLRIPWPAVSAILAVIALWLTIATAVRSSAKADGVAAKAEGVAEQKIAATDGLRDRVVRIETQIGTIQDTLKDHGADLKEVLKRLPAK